MPRLGLLCKCMRDSAFFAAAFVHRAQRTRHASVLVPAGSVHAPILTKEAFSCWCGAVCQSFRVGRAIGAATCFLGGT